jgi:hypothetical protein
MPLEGLPLFPTEAVFIRQGSFAAYKESVSTMLDFGVFPRTSCLTIILADTDQASSLRGSSSDPAVGRSMGME